MTAPAPSDPFSEPTKSETELSEPLSEFSCFSKLPLELRLEIWNLGMLPRTVDVFLHRIGRANSIDWPLVELYSRNPVPVSLQVCQESRAEAKRTYKLCFGTHLVTVEEKCGMFGFIRNPRTYFSYKMDTAHFQYAGIHMEGTLPIKYMMYHDVRNIRHIRSDWCEHVSESFIRQLLEFESLESFALSWHGQVSLGRSKRNGRVLDVVEVTEDNWQSLEDRPDIHQFMDSLITARDVFAPGMKLPRLKVISLNRKEIMKNMLLTLYGNF
jgi:hypothetical protein